MVQVALYIGAILYIGTILVLADLLHPQSTRDSLQLLQLAHPRRDINYKTRHHHQALQVVVIRLVIILPPLERRI